MSSGIAEPGNRRTAHRLFCRCRRHWRLPYRFIASLTISFERASEGAAYGPRCKRVAAAAIEFEVAPASHPDVAALRKLAVRCAGGQRLAGLRRCHQAQQRCRRGCQRSPGPQTTGGATTTGAGATTTTFGRQTPNASRCAPGPHPCAACASKLANDNSAAADATDRIILFICLVLVRCCRHRSPRDHMPDVRMLKAAFACYS